MRSALIACLLVLHAVPAAAQRRFVHDTLGPDMPTAVTCGFCASERFGVIFRELPPPRRGLEPRDFPITLDTIEIGLAAADVVAGDCAARATGGTVNAIVEVWSGSTPPTGNILDRSATDAWAPDETLVWATDAAPLALSSAAGDGTGRYELMFNVLEIRDAGEAPITIDDGAYVRVVVTLPAGTPGSSALCEPTYESPAGYPVRDDDGRIAPERSFIYAAGAGWYWNEAVPGGSINGDWGIRMSAFTTTPPDTDGGIADAGATLDGGAADGAVASDGGGIDGGTGDGDGGCGCRIGARSTATLGPTAAVSLLLMLFLRRR